MLSLLVSSALIIGFQGQRPIKPTPSKPMVGETAKVFHRPGIYDMTPKNIEGKVVPLSKYRGKVLLIVNVAGKSAQADQLAALQNLYKDKADEGLVVLAFPSADFGKEETRTNLEIKKAFEKAEYTFPLFAKMVVTEEKIDPLYMLLTRRGPVTKEIEGSFVKFVVDRKGRIVERFAPSVEPSSSDVKAAIERELDKKG